MTMFCVRVLYPAKSQIGRAASFTRGLLAVARHGVAIPWLAPVGGALCGPDEIARAGEVRQRPGTVIVDVADETEFAAARQHARHRRDGRILNKAPLPVPPLRPGIGMDQVDP